MPSPTCLLSLLLVALSTSFGTGCGKSNPYTTVPATGKITFSDGSLIQAARIDVQFISQEPPADSMTHPRPGVALVEPNDGTFVVSSYSFGDGLIRGRHKVIVTAYDENRRPLKSISPDYARVDTTPLEVNTEDGVFDLVIEKI